MKHWNSASMKIVILNWKTIMTNRECAGTYAVSAKSSDLLSKTGQSNYILNEIYHAMEWFGFTGYIIIDSL